MTHAQVLEKIKNEKLIAILRGVPQEKALDVVEALVEGGVKILEFTFDHDESDYIEKTCEKIRKTVERFSSRVIVGCGTALTEEEVTMAHRAGAVLSISPHVDERVIACARAYGMVSMPGALTPTEIMNAYRMGADIVKLFPAGEMGVSYIKAVRAPLMHIPMAAVGGVSPENVKDFLNAGVTGLGVGGKLVSRKIVEAGDYASIRVLAKQYADAVAAWKKSVE